MEIVTADSMQAYRGMDIGTAKPTAHERGGIRHHLIDVAGPGDEWGVARFISAAQAAIEEIEARGKRALLVGGTGLYVHALVDGFSVPGRWPDVEAALGQLGTGELFQRLSDLDAPGAARIDPDNRRRLLRALEVTLGSGRPFSSYGPGVGAFPATRWRLAGVWLPRAVLARRVEARFKAMMGAGLLAEVHGLAAGPEGLSRTARQALGYRELLAHIETGVPLEAAVAEAVNRTRRFARRQRLWWRRDPRVRWLGAAENPLAVLPALLGEWSDD
jgi:tRNA dimethylallyltransferase